MAGPNIYDQIINGSFDAIGMQPQQLPRRSGGGFLELLTDAEGLDGLPRRSANPVNQLGYAPVSGSVGRVFNSPGNYAPEDFAYSVQRAKEMTAPAERPAQWDRSLRALVESTVNGFMAPANALAGKYDQFVIDPETGKVLSMIDPRLMDDAAAMAGLVTTSGMPMPKPAGALGIFGGTMAKTADTAALAKAEQMAASGASRDEIWNATGWFKGADGKWRFEIPDNKAYYDAEALLELKQNAAAEGRQLDQANDTVSLDGVFGHKDLFSAYPDMADIPTHFLSQKTYGGGTTRGAYASDLDRLTLNGTNSADEMLPTGLHEMQHAVQTREGFARGGSVGTTGANALGPTPDPWVLDQAAELAYLGREWPGGLDAFLRDFPDKMPDGKEIHTAAISLARDPAELNKARFRYSVNTDPVLGYKHLAGEVEARNVETRKSLTPEQRRAKAPWLTQDVPDELQIVRFRP